MTEDKKIQEFMNRVKEIEKGHKIDLSSDEDLSIAIMNLISIEEHLFFTAEKTGKQNYYEILHQVREMRKELLKKIIKDYEGEVWCISKHLLASSMRIMEVATKALTKGDTKEAYDLFKKAYDLYNLFWGLNLGLVKKNDIGKIDQKDNEKNFVKKDSDLMGKISGFVGKILDCCRE
jgi:hypothetical protein